MKALTDCDILLYILLGTTPKYLEDTSYNTFVLKGEYQPAEQINLFVQGMYETANAKETKLPTATYDNERKSFGC